MPTPLNVAMSRSEEESFLLSVNEEPQALKNESVNKKTSVNVVTVLLSLIVTAVTVSMVTMNEPSKVAVNDMAANPASLWTRRAGRKARARQIPL